jgi:dephospho-CoA kinase
VIVVGLTGGIGSGKSAVAELLAAKGAEVIDADQLAREAVEPGTEALAAIVRRFGPGVLGEGGRLDREKMAAIAFSDPEALGDLNKITHPAVGALMLQRLATIEAKESEPSNPKVVVLEIPLLNRSIRARYPIDAVLVVDAPDEVRFQRLVTSRAMNPLDARQRMASQMPREERLELADYLIDNSGDRSALEQAVEEAWEWILELEKPSSQPLDSSPPASR